MNIVHTFTTCSHEYRVRIEQDEAPLDPFDKKEGWFQVVERQQHLRHNLFNCASGVHDQENCDTFFYEEIWRDRGSICYVVLKLSEALAKYQECMTGYEFKDGKYVRKPLVGHPGRFALVEWCKKEVAAAAELARQYAEGEVYGFVLERRTIEELEEWQSEEGRSENDDWEEVDSCWGFYGDDWKTNGMAEHINEEYYQKNDIEALNIEEQNEIDAVARALEGV